MLIILPKKRVFSSLLWNVYHTNVSERDRCLSTDVLVWVKETDVCLILSELGQMSLHKHKNTSVILPVIASAGWI